jgi:hypothetical protein
MFCFILTTKSAKVNYYKLTKATSNSLSQRIQLKKAKLVKFSGVKKQDVTLFDMQTRVKVLIVSYLDVNSNHGTGKKKKKKKKV